MKPDNWSAGIDTVSLNPRTRHVNFSPWPLCLRGKTLVAIELEAGWAPQALWTSGGRYKSVILAGVRTPDLPPRSIAKTPTTLFGSLYKSIHKTVLLHVYVLSHVYLTAFTSL